MGLGLENPSDLLDCYQVLHDLLCAYGRQSSPPGYILLLVRVGRGLECQEAQDQVHKGLPDRRQISPRGYEIRGLGRLPQSTPEEGSRRHSPLAR